MSPEATATAPADTTCEAGLGGGRIDRHTHRRLRPRAVGWGILAGALLLAVYFGILILANSAEHAVAELFRLWYWMTPLVLGFSLQIGLFAYARLATREEGGVHAHGVAASGGASTLSMVACCAHHVADVAPLLGLAGAAAVLATYQGLFLLLGVLSNLVGLIYILGLLKRHGLFPAHSSWLSRTLRLPFHRMLIPVAAMSALTLLAALVRTVA